MTEAKGGPEHIWQALRLLHGLAILLTKLAAPVSRSGRPRIEGKIMTELKKRRDKYESQRMRS